MERCGEIPVERHPLEPFIPEGARILMLDGFLLPEFQQRHVEDIRPGVLR